MIAIDGFLQLVKEKKILVVGDLMLDQYLFGDSERISPEAPIPVVGVVREESRLGGAANVANNLISLGCRVGVAAVVGDDVAGAQLQQLFEERGIAASGVFSARERMTTIKTRVLSAGQQMLRIDREDAQPLSVALEKALFERVAREIETSDAVILSDYLKGVLTETLLARIIALCRERQCPVVIDPKRSDWSVYRGATVLTPNLKELQRAVAAPAKVAELEEAICAAQLQVPDSVLLVTLGKDGMRLVGQGQDVHIHAEAKEVFDVSGAGDTVTALLAAGLACGYSLTQAAELANTAAGIVVGKVGTATVECDELRLSALNRNRRQADFSGKLFCRDELALLLDSLRKKGMTIVFTNGCFDLLHAGHVKYLQQARGLGDLLVLGLNSDTSVRRLKGEKRPLLSQDERAQLLSALDCVDFLCLFDEDTPYELIRTLHPQILVKGGDYADKEVVGSDLVVADGGSVELIEFVPGRSTSLIIDDILARYGK
jgi:D-beta-D-heptose 7-phosphate kinase/D-beta-D-heptose 1-phosphate adenosyltransferase